MLHGTGRGAVLGKTSLEKNAATIHDMMLDENPVLRALLLQQARYCSAHPV
jgi:hypothetical protein